MTQTSRPPIADDQVKRTDLEPVYDNLSRWSPPGRDLETPEAAIVVADRRPRLAGREIHASPRTDPRETGWSLVRSGRRVTSAVGRYEFRR